MPANTQPIFSVTPSVEWSVSMVAFNATTDLTTGTTYSVFTGGTNGSYVQKIRFRHQGTNSATVVRVFINNGGVTTTASNNTLYDEITLAANTIVQNAASINYELPLGFALPAGYRIYCTFGTSTTGGIIATVIGGDY
jgi:hypothetical protein